ncbi:putative mitochondrial carrier protein [Phaeoacremonium minimum UCRPA7]|uniref:Putative mitochondrial carrier protein n=1 Tax=Phaeoacremonium minimum (strain UCR-PA7) TaxID=1286976 RepID=R8BFX7_PHAM7|nr:putative mitochondrial carrier protein [Phaeoacremonium minimum UCRPA7]EON98192.1 putative mitochondrial carrier protein [Phaeoacremonium minimum UCRPA7]
MAGAVAAFTVDLLVYPLDTIKTRLQSQDYIKTYAKSASAPKSSIHVFRGLYQGVGSVIIATLPAAGVFFTTYEAAKTFYSGLVATSPVPVPQAVVHAIASGTAELASCLVLTPSEVIKQNAQMIRQSQGGLKGGSASMQALRMLWKSEGGPARRLLTGYTALAARNLPFTALQFPVFEATRRRIWEYRDRTRGSSGRGGSTMMDGDGGVGGGERRLDGKAWRGLLETGTITGLSAGLSGMWAATITTPLDVVKTRMMLSAGHDTAETSTTAPAGRVQKTRSPTGGLQMARMIYQERGVRGLFRGGAFRAGWTFIGSGLYLGTYEMAKVYLKGDKDGRDDDVI